ncbi:MAG: TolC family protein [Allomuricauda sp.]
MNPFKTLFFCVLWLGHWSQAQAQLTLQECYDLAKTNYPLIKQYGLIQNAGDFSVDNIITGVFPTVSINAQATYQSDVTSVPAQIPGMDIPTVDKDQYKIYAEIQRTLYDGNRIDKEVKIAEAVQQVEQGQVDVELYGIYKRISQLYLGILLLDQQIGQNGLQAKDIQIAIEKTQARIDNGTAIESDYYALNANLLSINQNTTELKALKKAYYQMLGAFIHENIDENTTLIKPQAAISEASKISRPELNLLDQRISLVDMQSSMLNVKVTPKVSVFAQAGYGKPGLNMLSNDFDTYFLGGVRFQWSLFNYYTHKKERKINDIEKDKLLVQKETFLFNTNLELTQQQSEIDKYQELLATDDNIIKMYASVKETSLFQLENGTIDVNDYLRDVNQESKAVQNKALHEIKLLMLIEEQKITQGI